MMTTASRPSGNDRHVTPAPVLDRFEHEASPICWCQPVVNYEDPATGDRVYIHRRAIDGQVYEIEP